MLTIAMYRLIFHDRVSAALAPTLFILLTPPSAGFLAYMQLNGGQLDVLSRTLFCLALFVAAALVGLAPVFLRARFSLSWWAFTFPSAALSMATLRYHEFLGTNASLALAVVALCVAVGLFWITALRTAAWLLLRAVGEVRVRLTAGSTDASAVRTSIPAGARGYDEK
jgi:tellurite resistance protein